MRFRLEEWDVDTERGLLRDAGRERRPEPTVLRLLEALAARPGELVPRERLIAEVWDGRHVTQGALTVAVCGLRKALGDDPRRPRFVRTYPGRGYSLLAAPVESDSPAAEPPAGRAERTPRWLGYAALLGTLLAFLGMVGSHSH